MTSEMGRTESTRQVDDAAAALVAGHSVVVSGDGYRDGGVLLFAAGHATSATVAFSVRHTSGFLCVALHEDRAARLGLPPMHPEPNGRGDCSFAVAVDARDGITTGISARDRAHTIGLLADPCAGLGDFRRPGHVVPVRAHRSGVLGRLGYSEAGVDLMGLAGLEPVAGFSDIVSTVDPTRMPSKQELRDFADRHGLVFVSLSAIVRRRMDVDSAMSARFRARIPTTHGTFTAIGCRAADDQECLALTFGDLSRGSVLVHLHRECILGDVFGGTHCDCAAELDAAIHSIIDAGAGVVLYLRHREGDIAAALGDRRDETALTRSLQPRHCSIGEDDLRASAEALVGLGVESIRLSTEQMGARDAFERSGVRVTASTVPAVVEALERRDSAARAHKVAL